MSNGIIHAKFMTIRASGNDGQLTEILQSGLDGIDGMDH